MTVPSTVNKAGPFLCDGVQKEFPFDFPVVDPNHIQVWVNDTPVIYNWYVTLADRGGTVTFTEPPAVGSKVSIIRDIPIDQLMDLQNNTAFLPEVLETAHDKVIMICQMLAEAIARCYKVSPNGEAIDLSGLVAEMRKAVADAKRYAEEAKNAAGSAGGGGAIDIDPSLAPLITVEVIDGVQTLKLTGAEYLTDMRVLSVNGGAIELIETAPCIAESGLGA